jgi:Ni,Fe-hydrogenase maturation factor
MKLYELSHSYSQLLERIESGDHTVEDLRDTLEAIEEAIELKVENIVKMLKITDAQAEVLRQEEKRLADRRRAFENSSQRLKLYAEEQLKKTGIQKVKGNLFTIYLQKNPPSVEILDEGLIPSDYIKTVASVDKKLILEALKAGEAITGCEIRQSESLRIQYGVIEHV